MNDNTYDIVLVYNNECLNNEDLKMLKRVCLNYGLSLYDYERSPFINASIDFFVPIIQIMLSPENVNALCQGIATNAIYDVIKRISDFIYQKFHKKPMYKFQVDKVTEESANIQFMIGNNVIVLPVDVDNDKFQYVVDRFLEIASSTTPNEQTYTYLSENQNFILRKTEKEIIQEEYEKQLRQKQS